MHVKDHLVVKGTITNKIFLYVPRCCLLLFNREY